MDPDVALNEARHAIFETDLVRAREHLEDVSNWINIGGYIPSGFFEVLAQYTELEIELTSYL